jgi:hypothetical protein
MNAIIIDIDATDYASSLSYTIATTINSIENGTPIPVIGLFDTPAFSPSNPSGIEQLTRRDPFVLVGPAQWASKVGMAPLRLQYKLYQEGKPIRLDVVADGDMTLTINVDTAGKTLHAEQTGKFSLYIRDPIVVQGHEMPIDGPLVLRNIVVTENFITYALSKKDDAGIFLTVRAIYCPEFALEALGKLKVKVSIAEGPGLTDKVMKVFAESLMGNGCLDAINHEKKYMLWAKNGICSTTSGDICLNINPTDPDAENLGCYDSQSEADAAANASPKCYLLHGYTDPFSLAKEF